MSTAKWHETHMVGLDTETTGVNPLEDRIVTAAIVHLPAAGRPRAIQWLIHPGRDIPTEASDVHGWTLDRVERRLAVSGAEAIRFVDGNAAPMTREAALFEIAAQVGTAIGAAAPLVVHNAAYDLTLLETELGREGIDTLSSRPAGIAGVVDPMVIEKAYDPFRKVKGGCRGGKHQCGGCGAEDKKLGSLCRHYGVVHTGEHDAAADVLAAMRLARRFGQLWPEIGRWKLGTLHAHQVTWRREQADSLRAYFDRAGIEHDGIDPGWPVHTSLTREAVPAR